MVLSLLQINFIKSLYVYGTSRNDIPPTRLENLARLRVEMKSGVKEMDPVVERALNSLTGSSPRVEEPDIECYSINWELVSQLERLRSLPVRSRDLLGATSPESLWTTVCPRLCSLCFKNVGVPNDGTTPIGLIYSNIQCLKIERIPRILNTSGLLVLAYRCANLEDFAFSMSECAPAMRDLVQHATEGTWLWSKIHSLRLDLYKFTANDMSTLLKCIESYRARHMPFVQIDGRSFQDLSRHVSTLEEIDLGTARNVKSTTIQCIMEFRPRLLSIRGSRILLINIAHGESWSCKSFKSSTVFFDPSETPPSPRVRPGDGLELSIAKGLEALTPLKKLKTLRLRHTKQGMSREDIAWMLDA
ncbi:hypothetical protein BGX26_012436 [Mortierella sp. AD094]|nr:hypothetical protein BGX26_012436 [Mortierella sp. AD094]